MDRPEKLSNTTVALHWVVALGMLSLATMGVYMTRTETWGLYEIHKSIALLLLPLCVLRAAWRLRQGWPQPTSVYTRWEQRMAKLVHVGLLACTLLMPLTGMLFSGASGHGFGVFGWVLLTPNIDPAHPGEVLDLSETWSQIGQASHSLLGYLMLAMVSLHALGALKHHLLDGDRSLLRMLGRGAAS